MGSWNAGLSRDNELNKGLRVSLGSMSGVEGSVLDEVRCSLLSRALELPARCSNPSQLSTFSA
jgi:hypothetical protein